jgi:hypothetical protein
MAVAPVQEEQRAILVEVQVVAG